MFPSHKQVHRSDTIHADKRSYASYHTIPYQPYRNCSTICSPASRTSDFINDWITTSATPSILGYILGYHSIISWGVSDLQRDEL